jgi:DNA-binding NarL/FixJ family response regulator
VIRVAIQAESELERAGLAAFLAAEDDMTVVDAHAEDDADVFIVVVRGVLDESSVRAAQRAPVLLVIDESGPLTVAQAFRAGAQGVAWRDTGAVELAAAVRAVYAGWAVAPHSAIVASLAPERSTAELIEPLTPRELEVLRMLADGHSNKQIAFDLGISGHTVKFHVNSILNKLGAGTRTEAVTLGLRNGLILL